MNLRDRFFSSLIFFFFFFFAILVAFKIKKKVKFMRCMGWVGRKLNLGTIDDNL